MVFDPAAAVVDAAANVVVVVVVAPSIASAIVALFVVDVAALHIFALAAPSAHVAISVVVDVADVIAAYSVTSLAAAVVVVAADVVVVVAVAAFSVIVAVVLHVPALAAP